MLSAPKYIGMIYLNVGKMCLIPMNMHNEQLNGVRQQMAKTIRP